MRYTNENTAKIGKPMDAYLDGVLIDDVLEADTSEGYLIRSVRNAEGFLCLDKNGDLAIERLVGTVVVKPKEL